MSKNLRNIIRETLNESDFDWIGEDLIKVGNCFIMDEYLHTQIDKIDYNYSYGVDSKNWRHSIPARIRTQKHLNLNDERDFIEIHFKYRRYPINIDIRNTQFTKTYSEVEKLINNGTLVPIECK